MSSIQEQNILNGIIAGDSATIKAFYKRNWRVIHEYITKNGGTEQEAEDIFQDALVCLYQKGKTEMLTMTTATIHTYFYKICKNLWFGQLRNKRAMDTAKKQWEVHQKEENTVLIQEQEWMEERRQLFTTHLEQLSNTGKQLMQLVATGMRMEDIAIRMGYSEGYTRRKRFKTKEALLKKLSKNHRFWELSRRC